MTRSEDGVTREYPGHSVGSRAKGHPRSRGAAERSAGGGEGGGLRGGGGVGKLGGARVRRRWETEGGGGPG